MIIEAAVLISAVLPNVAAGVGIGILSLFVPGGNTIALILSAMFGWQHVIGAMAVQMMFGMIEVMVRPGATGDIVMDTVTGVLAGEGEVDIMDWQMGGLLRMGAYVLGIILINVLPMIKLNLFLAVVLLGVVAMTTRDKGQVIFAAFVVVCLTLSISTIGRIPAALPIVLVTLSSANLKAIKETINKKVILTDGGGVLSLSALVIASILPWAGVSGAICSALNGDLQEDEEGTEVISISSILSSIFLSAFSDGVAIGMLISKDTGKSMATDLIGKVGAAEPILFTIICSVIVTALVAWVLGDWIVKAVRAVAEAQDSHTALKYINLGVVFFWSTINGHAEAIRLLVALLVTFTSHCPVLLELLSRVPARARLILPLATVVTSSLIS